MHVGYWFEIWRRPGHPQFGRLIDGPPIEKATFHIGVGLIGDGNMTLPDNYDRINEILRVAGASSTSSLVRIREDATGQVVGEWLPSMIIPSTSKEDATIEVSGNSIFEILGYAMTDAFDWDGSADWEPKFPDWIWGGRNILGNPGMEDLDFVASVYKLVIDATAGTFTLSDGTGNTAPLSYKINDGALEGAIETLAGSDDVLVVPLEGQALAYRLTINADGGTFIIGDGVSDTTDIAWNASAATIETRLIADIAAINDVDVSFVNDPDGDYFLIDFIDPVGGLDLRLDTTNLTRDGGDGSGSLTASRTVGGFEITYVTPPVQNLTLNDFGLTGNASLIIIEAGEELPSRWTHSMQVSAGTPRDYGTYTAFNPSTAQAHSGTTSLFIDPAPITSYLDRYAGTQQVVTVIAGGLYQASIWVYPTAPGQSYRLVIRGIDEDLISTPLFAGNISPPANQWTQIKLTDVVIPDDVTQAIFRFANINQGGNPAGFYVDDAVFAEGMAATTVGKIVRLLYESYTDPLLRTPIVWDDGSGTDTPYLTLDFTDTVDSAGNVWANPEVSIRIWMRMHGLQVIENLEEQEGIEARVVPNSEEAGTWKLQIYDLGSMDATLPGDPSVAILGGADDTRRLIRAFRPHTHFMVEGEERVTSRAAAAVLSTAFGRMELGDLSREATGLDSTRAKALLDASTAETVGLVWSYELTNPQNAPLVDYVLGDRVMVHDPPVADGEGRLWEMNVVFSKEATTWDIDILVEGA